MHDLWREFVIAETKSQGSRDRRWVFQAGGRTIVDRTSQWRESVERMWFVNEGCNGLKGLNLADFVNVEAFQLHVLNHVETCALDLDLSGLIQLKSLVLNTHGLAIRVGLSALTTLGYLLWSMPGFSPSFHEIRRLKSFQYL